MMSVVQATYRAMLRDQIAPAMRALGLEGSLTNYRFADRDALGVMSFQSSMGKDRDLKRFTINLYAVSRADRLAVRRREPGQRERRPDTYGALGLGWQQRIGMVMPIRRDTWWEIRPDTNPAPVAMEVITAICDFGLPAIRANMAGNASRRSSWSELLRRTRGRH
jgi:hypothetical protein